MTSSRLSGKVVAPVGGIPMLAMMVRRLQRSSMLAGICLATTTNAVDDELEALAASLGMRCWRGSEDDVLGRVLDAARSVDADVIVETTGDCPMVDWGLLDDCVHAYFADDLHYCSNNRARHYPLGLDVQVFSTDVLADVDRRTDDAADREHVSLFIYEHPSLYRLGGAPLRPDLYRPDWRWTVDTPDDLQLVRSVVAELGHGFSAAEAVVWLDAHPDVIAVNRAVAQKPVR